ncbi:uncharacterized protein LOC132450257 [Gadus macrocephalus]|uniref:uncharacterized protein LOC132450257 n=1 Tax=Gadus macrocephalus TaxID=80720 RepID=UPI0028CB757A|nr:uncharacterized protein LOC132450257 [Gadus macrocephalus]
MAPHHCRICSAAMSADDGHRECPDCLGAVHVLEDVGNPCSAAVDLSRGERLRRANQVRGHAQEGRAERRRSPLRLPRSRKRGHKHTRRHSEDRQYEPAKRPAPAEAAGGGSAESRHILAVLQALTERLGRLEEQRGPPSLPSGQQCLPLRRPDSQVEQEDEANDVISLLKSQATEDTTGGAGRGGEPRTDSRGESTGVGETPVSSLMSRVLSAANILGLQPPTPDPVPQGGVWDGVSHTSPPPSIPVAEDYTRMLTSSWGRASKRPQFNAGCRQLAMTVYPAETGLGDMPPVEESIASWTSLGPARVSSNPSCPHKECAKTDRLVTRSFNASARAARTGKLQWIQILTDGGGELSCNNSLHAFAQDRDPADGDAMGLVEAALSAHSQLTRDVGDSMAAAVLCRRQVWLAQTSLPEAIRTELLNLPVAPGPYLRFAFQGRAFQFQVLPFGLSLAPRVFSRVVSATLAPLQVVRDTNTLLAHIQFLGFTVNWKKSNVQPRQQAVFLGILFDSASMKASLTGRRAYSLIETLKHFRLGKLVTANRAQRLLGLMAAAAVVVPLGLLRSRPFQCWFNAFQLDPRDDRQVKLRVSRACIWALRPWRNREFLLRGVPLGGLHTGDRSSRLMHP